MTLYILHFPWKKYWFWTSFSGNIIRNAYNELQLPSLKIQLKKGTLVAVLDIHISVNNNSKSGFLSYLLMFPLVSWGFTAQWSYSTMMRWNLLLKVEYECLQAFMSHLEFESSPWHISAKTKVLTTWPLDRLQPRELSFI